MFIAFEGCDGAGKSTQSKLLAEYLKEAGRDVLAVRDPGTTPEGEKIRALVVDKNVDLQPPAVMLLYTAARSQLAWLIKQAREEGKDVVTDRYSLSTLVYQGYGQGIDKTLIKACTQKLLFGQHPDVTFIIDVDVGAAARRKAQLPPDIGQCNPPGQFNIARNQDRFETKGLAFQETLRKGYLACAKMPRTVVVEGEYSPIVIHQNVVELCQKMLPEFPRLVARKVS